MVPVERIEIYSMNHQRTNKLIIIPLCLLLIAVGIFVLFGLSRVGKTPITFNVAPSSSKVTVDSKRVKSGDTIYMTKGTHNLIAILENFSAVHREFSVGNKNQTLDISLNPVNNVGQSYLQKNPQYQQEREAIGGQETEARALLAQSPLIKLLPVIDISGPYRIDYGQSTLRPGNSVIIIADSSPNGRSKAVAWIAEQGYDPADLEIRFSDFNNPLLGGKQL